MKTAEQIRADELGSYGLSLGTASTVTVTPREDELDTLARKLTVAGRELLQQIAGHEYAWAYISPRRVRTADALVRRELAEYGDIHGRDHWNSPAVCATSTGLDLIRHLWPSCPAALRTYAHDGRRWTDPAPAVEATAA